jgi:hypothetical protein
MIRRLHLSTTAWHLAFAAIAAATATSEGLTIAVVLVVVVLLRTAARRHLTGPAGT